MARKKSAQPSFEHSVFGDEEAAALRAELTDLRGIVGELTAQVQSQFTTIAAHAEIARQHADFVREEAQANLDRTREMLIGLLEQARGGTREPRDGMWAPPAPSMIATTERVDAIELAMAKALDTVQYCLRRQQDLAATMEALLDTVVFEQRNEPVLRLA